MAGQPTAGGTTGGIHFSVRPSSLVATACLTVGMLLSLTGSSLAVSGLASTGPAVRAQYPDAAELAPAARAAAPVASLSELRKVRRRNSATGPVRAKAEEAHAEAQLTARTATALAPVGPGVRDYGSIPLLAAGMVLMAIAGTLRSRREKSPAS